MFKDYANELREILHEMQKEVIHREHEMTELANTEKIIDGEFASGAVENYYNVLQAEMDVFDDACGWLENAIQVLMEG